MPRVSKNVTKYYDEDIINGWKLMYEYESDNGSTPKEFKVTAEKDGKNATITLGGGNTFVNWNGSPADKEVLVSVLTEFDVIASEFNNAG